MSKEESLSALIILAVGGYFWWTWPDKDVRPEHMESGSPSQSQEVLPSVKPMENAYKHALIHIVDKYTKIFFSSQNDVQKGKNRIDRGREICNVMPSNKFNNWEGTIERFSTNSEGSMVDVISVRLGENTTITDKDNLFGEGTKIYNLLLNNLNTGDKVKISGSFYYDQGDRANDCFFELSLTLSGGMMEPDFSVSLTDLDKIN